MKNRLLSIVLSAILILSFVTVTAQDTIVSAEELPEDPGVTPDNLLWGIDRALENINLALTFDKSSKAQKGLQHAHERLLEVKAMIEKNELEHAEKAELAHKRKLEKVRTNILSLTEEKEGDIKKVVELENSLDDQEDELENIRTKIKIKIEGELTDEQKRRLFAFLNSLEENIDELELELENKRDRTKIKIRERTGKTEIETEDKLGRLKEKRKVKAKVFDDFSKVKVEYKFTIKTTDREEVIKHIINKFALTEEEVTRLLKIERGDDDEKDDDDEFEFEFDDSDDKLTPNSLTDVKDDDDDDEEKRERKEEKLKIKVEIKTKHGVSFAKIKVKLKFIDGTDRESIIKEIVSRTQLTEKEILDVIEFKQKDIEKDKKRIKVKIREDKGFSEVKIKWLGKKLEFRLKTTNREIILKEISIRLGVPVEDLLPFVEFKVETEEEDEEDDEEKENLIDFYVNANGTDDDSDDDEDESDDD